MAGFLTLWSTTAADNDDVDASINWAEGQTPGSVNNSARALMAAVASWRDDINGSLSTAGSSNAYTIAAPNINYASLSRGLIVGFKANHANTGAATLNVNSLGAKAIRTQGDEALSVGMILSSGHYMARYDTALNSGNGAWALLNPSPITQPIGAVIDFAGSSAPTGWLFCAAQNVSRTTYAALFAVIGTTYGSGDGSTTFTLPDARGRLTVGKDNMTGSAASRVTSAGSGVDGATLGATGGAQTVTLATADIPSHTHTGTTNAESGHTHGVVGTTAAEGAHTHTVSGTTGTESATHTHNSTVANNRNASIKSAGTGTDVSVWGEGSATLATGGQSVNHTHDFSVTSGAGSSHTHAFAVTSETGSAHSHTFTTAASGGGGAHNNMPPSIVFNKIIYAGV